MEEFSKNRFYIELKEELENILLKDINAEEECLNTINKYYNSGCISESEKKLLSITLIERKFEIANNYK